jgi:hypothetical protein
MQVGLKVRFAPAIALFPNVGLVPLAQSNVKSQSIHLHSFPNAPEVVGDIFHRGILMVLGARIATRIATRIAILTTISGLRCPETEDVRILDIISRVIRAP